MLLFTSLSTAVYSSCAFAFNALVRLLFSTVFLSPCFQLVDGVGRDPFFVLCLLLAKDLFTCVKPELLAVFPLCFNVCLVVFYQLLQRLEPVGKADLESCLCVLVSEQSNIVLCPCAVGVGESLEAKSHCCHKKVVVWWHISTSHHSYIPPWCPELAANTYVVDLVLRDVIRRYPRGLMDALVWQDAASYHQLVQGAQVCKAPTIFIHLSQSMCPHDALVTRVVHSILGI